MPNNYRLFYSFRSLCVCLLPFVISHTMAQTGQAPVIQWQRLLGPAYEAYPLQVTRARDNGYAISYSKVSRFSEGGTTLWESTIPPSPEYPSYTNTPTLITGTPDGGFAVLTYNQFKWSLVRLNTDGVVLWMKTFADNLNNSSQGSRTLTNLIYTTDGGFLVTATMGVARAGSSTEVYKFDSAGNTTLTRIISVRNPNDPRPVASANRVIQTSDGNYLLVGAASDPERVLVTLMSWAIKLDQQLNTIWEKYISGQRLYDVVSSPYANGSTIAVSTIAGTDTRSVSISANGDVAEGVTLPNRATGTQSLIVAGLSSRSHTIIDIINERQGDIRLQNLLDQNQNWLLKLGGSSAETVKSIVASSDGGYLLVGTTSSTDGDVQGKTTNDLSAWMVKLGPVLVTGDIYSVRSGNWNDPSIWSCNCIPAANNNVAIKDTHKVVLDATMAGALCQNLEILGTFSMQGGSILVNGVQIADANDNIITR